MFNLVSASLDVFSFVGSPHTDSHLEQQSDQKSIVFNGNVQLHGFTVTVLKSFDAKIVDKSVCN